mmetsp:Transcript_17252/g.42467  ORF Transcript_17252/g.42467 Transcript_17252/m.42467 type:complete len:814 (+) Transcript_17252:130-2571(+)
MDLLLLLLLLLFFMFTCSLSGSATVVALLTARVYSTCLQLRLGHVLDGLDQVLGALHHLHLHLARVRHGGVLHAEAHDGAVQLVEQLLVDQRADGGADAAGTGGLVQDGQPVRLGQGGAHGLHVEGLHARQLDQVDVVPQRQQLRQRVLRLLGAVQVGDDGDGLARLDGRLGGGVHHGGLVQGQEVVHGDLPARLHQLHRQQQHARPVVADHALGQPVRLLRLGGAADLEPRDAHDVGVEGLGVLGAQGLVGGRAAGADHRHGHLELPAGGGVRVARRGQLGHAVDAEVGVHQLHHGAVPVHGLAQRFADEVALVDDLVGGAQGAERLLRVGGDVVRRTSLQVLGVRHRGGVAQHLLEDGEVDGVADGDALDVRRHGAEGLDARLDGGQDGLGHRALRHHLGHLQAHLGLALGVVHHAVGVGVLELRGEGGGGRRRRVGEVQRRLHLQLGLVLARLHVHALGVGGLLEDGDGVRLHARPPLLVLAVALVLGVGGRVSVEAERVHLQNGGALGAHVLDGGAPHAQGVLHVLAVHQDAGHAVVLALVEHLLVLRHVLGEGVDGAAVVDHHKQDGQVLLGGGVEALRHAPVLRPALAHEHHGDAVVSLPSAEVGVQADGARGADGVGQLLGHQRPAPLEVVLHVVDVHGAPRAAAGASVAPEQLRHDLAAVHAGRDGVRVVAVVRVLQVALADGVVQQRRDGLLPVVQVHEAADLARHVRLVALVLEVAAVDHHGVRLRQLLVAQLPGGLDVGVGHAERSLEGKLGLLPWRLDAQALQPGRRAGDLSVRNGGAHHACAALLRLGAAAAGRSLGRRR